MRILGILCTFFLMAGAALAATDRLIVPEAVCVDEAVITLAHLARAEGERSSALLARIGDTPLLAAPGFNGAKANLNGPRLRALIVQRLGSQVAGIQIPPQVIVQRGGQVLESRTLWPEIAKILTKALASYDGEVQTRDYRMADSLFVTEKAPVQLRARLANTAAPGRNSLRLEAVTENGRVVQSFTGTVFADVWKTVPCAARVLNRGDILTPELVTFVRKNLAYLGRPAWDGLGMPLRMVAAVGAEQIISSTMVEPVPVVSRGQLLNLVYAGKTLKLSVPAESLEEGAMGAIIRVRNTQSRNVVAARVVDAETVQVQ